MLAHLSKHIITHCHQTAFGHRAELTDDLALKCRADAVADIGNIVLDVQETDLKQLCTSFGNAAIEERSTEFVVVMLMEHHCGFAGFLELQNVLLD